MDIPHDDIRETLDRGWSFHLFGQLQREDIDDETANDLLESLGELEDPRLRVPLVAIALDRSKPVVIRKRMLNLMGELGWNAKGDLLREWWSSGDEPLQVACLGWVTQDEADVVRPIASDPLHPLYRHAIAALEVGLEETEWQQYKIAALSHFDPEVRRTAAESLLFDQPVAAEDKLIQLARNDDDAVALEALFTLKFYESRKTLRALYELREHQNEDLAERADDYLREMANSFKLSRDQHFETEAARRRFAAWLSPIADIVALYSSDDPYFPSDSDAPVLEQAPPLADAVRLLDEVSGKWRPKVEMLREMDWSTYSDSDRCVLGSYLVNHVDPVVREEGTIPLSAWQDTDNLLLLAQDSESTVRKRARYHLLDMPQRRDVAEVLWSAFESTALYGFAAREALATWAHHYGGDTSDVLVDLAINDPRESVRHEAVSLLTEKDARRLEPILAQPPLLTWSVHDLVLSMMLDAKVRPSGLKDLRDVDDLHLAETLAEFD